MASSSAAGSDRAAKLRRLNALRRTCPHLTASALAGVLNEIEEQGLPDLHNRWNVAEAADAELQMHDSYGPLIFDQTLKCIDDTNMEITMVNPLSLLSAAYTCAPYYDLLNKTAAKHNNMLSIILYFDEVVPGDPIGYANRRKVWVSYLSFKEFGPRVLSNERVWLPVLELRTSMACKLASGISQVCKFILRAMLLNPICDVRNLGILLKSSAGDSLRLRLKLAYILQDGAAHKAIFCLKGDKGTRFCVLCKNCFAVDSDEVDDDGELLFRSDKVFEHQCKFATTNELKGTLERLQGRHAQLQNGEIKKKEFHAWEKAAGFNFEPHGLVFDRDLGAVLDPTSHYLHDWMHCIFVVGIFNTVVYLLLKAVKEASGKPLLFFYNTLYEFVGLWKLPSDKSGDLKQCFTSK